MIPLDLGAQEAVFIVFRKPAMTQSHQVQLKVEKEFTLLDSGCVAKSRPGRGVADSVAFESLSSWTTSENPCVKVFSGTADYRRTLPASAAWLHSRQRGLLDLGDVRDVAEDTENGRSIGQLWKAPYRIEVTAALHAGTNQVSVRVTNLCVNRLIGDQQSGASTKYTFTTFKPYGADSQMLPSGLLGPVRKIASQSRPEVLR